MHKSQLLKATTLAAALVTLGASLGVDQAAAQSGRDIFARKFQGKQDSDEQRDHRDNKREIIDFANRGDIKPLPAPLKNRLIRLAKRPHTFLPMTLFAEAKQQSQLFQY